MFLGSIASIVARLFRKKEEIKWAKIDKPIPWIPNPTQSQFHKDLEKLKRTADQAVGMNDRSRGSMAQTKMWKCRVCRKEIERHREYCFDCDWNQRRNDSHESSFMDPAISTLVDRISSDTYSPSNDFVGHGGESGGGGASSSWDDSSSSSSSSGSDSGGDSGGGGSSDW